MLYHSFGFFGARLGVSAFFVLSGFLITWLLLQEHSKTKNISLNNFYYRRTLRIFPAYFGFLFIIFTVEAIQDFESLKEFILPSTLYYYNYYYPITGNKHPALGHLWSLCVEEQFYLIWPLLFAYAQKKGVRHVLILLALIITGGLLWRCYGYFELGLTDRWLYRTFDSRFDNLAIGCFFAVILNNLRLRRTLWQVVSQVTLLPIFILCLIASRALGTHEEMYSYTLGFTIEALLIGLILTQCIAFNENIFIRWLNNKAVVFIGTISYPMYLYHELAAGSSEKVGAYISSWLGIAIDNRLFLIMGFAATIIVAYLSYRYIETPFLKLKDAAINIKHLH